MNHGSWWTHLKIIFIELHISFSHLSSGTCCGWIDTHVCVPPINLTNKANARKPESGKQYTGNANAFATLYIHIGTESEEIKIAMTNKKCRQHNFTIKKNSSNNKLLLCVVHVDRRGLCCCPIVMDWSQVATTTLKSTAPLIASIKTTKHMICLLFKTFYRHICNSI